MRLRQLQTRCKYWQEQLKLKDWDITLVWMTKESHDVSGDVGLCSWFTEESTATIRIYQKTNQESALVHELLHLCLDGHKPYEGYDINQETAINKIAEALLKNA